MGMQWFSPTFYKKLDQKKDLAMLGHENIKWECRDLNPGQPRYRECEAFLTFASQTLQRGALPD